MTMTPNPTPPPTPAPTPKPKKRKQKPAALADTLRDWEALLDAVGDHAATLAPIDPHRAALADSLTKVKAAKMLQESHQASRAATTQSLEVMVAEGKDRATVLRAAIRTQLGTRTAQLGQFGIRAIRHKPRHPVTPTPPPQPEVAAAEPGKKTA
jgi:hypothetical protein